MPSAGRTPTPAYFKSINVTQNLRDVVRRLGPWRTMLVVVGLSTIVSAALTYGLSLIWLSDHLLRATAFGIVVPMVIAPPVMMIFLNLTSELDRAEERFKQMAILDELTGAFNRHYLKHVSAGIVASVTRRQAELAGVMLDIDFFKRINDTYGHHVGDLVLIEFKRRVESCMRPGDLLVRMGGEEFLLLLSGFDRYALSKIGERLRKTVCATPVVVNGSSIELTTSAGIAYLNKDEDGLDEMIRRADGLLYRAKEQGRNMVISQ